LPSLVCPFSSIIRPPVLHEHSAKERAGFGGSEDPKFSGEWRRQGPLPDLDSRDSSRRRNDGPPSDRPSGVSETSRDWRSNRPSRPPLAPESEAPRRKNSAFVGSEGGGAADREETWTIGGKFKPSEDDGPGRKFGSNRGRGDMGPPSSIPPESPADNDWRSGPRAGLSSHSSTSRKSIILPFRAIIHLRP
jgi:translation initiation factor 4B